MDKRTINDEIVAENGVRLPSVLDEIVQAGAQRMLIAALEAEVEAYIQAHKSERDKAGQALVVPRAGFHAAPAGNWRVDRVEMAVVEISATEIRRALRQGKPIGADVPPAVAEYIGRHRLYRS